MTGPLVITLLSRPGCHLCDDAREVLRAVLAGRPGVTLVERDITTDAGLRARWATDVPVVLVGERVHGRWRVDGGRLLTAIDEALAHPRPDERG